MAIPFYYNPATNELELTADPSPLRDSLGTRFGLNEISTARKTLSPIKSYTAESVMPSQFDEISIEEMEDIKKQVKFGQQVKDGGRIDMKPGGIVEPGVEHYGQLVQPGLGRQGYNGAEATASSFLKKYEAKFGEDALNEAAQFLEGKNYSELKNANTRAKIRYQLKKFGSVLGAEDSKKRSANIRAKRDAKIKINLIEATQEGFFEPKEFIKKNKITLEQLKTEAKQLQKSIYKKRGILTGTKSASTLEWLIPINEFKLDNTLKKLSLSGLTVFQENRTSVILYDAFGRKFEKGSTTKLNPTRDLPKYDVIKKNLHEFEVLKRAITKKYPSIKFEWDHTLSKQTIKAFMTGTAEDLSRVNILDAKLNKGFKKSLSEKYFKSLTAKDGKVDLEAKRAVEKIAKDLKLNIGNISDDVKKFEHGVGSLETLNIRDEIIKSLKNQKDLSANFKSYLKNNPELFEIAGFKDTSKLGTKLTQVTDKHIQEIKNLLQKVKNTPKGPGRFKIISTLITAGVGLHLLNKYGISSAEAAEAQTLETGNQEQEASVLSAVADNPIKSAVAAVGADVALNKAKLSLKSLRGVDRALGPWMTPLIGLYTAITGSPPDPTSAANLLIPSFWNSIMKRYGWTSKLLDKNIPLKTRIFDMAKRGLIPAKLMPVISRASGIGTAVFAAKYVAEESQPNIFRDEKTGDLKMKDEQITTLPSNMIKDYHWRFQSDDFFEKEYGIKKEDYKSELPEFLDLEKQKVRRQRPEPLDSYFMGGIASLIK